MGKRVTYRHNSDGSIRKTTTYSHKGIFGTTSHTYVENKQKKGCYVATCVYGSYDCPEVWTLRRYRDLYLAKSLLGRCFISCYYAISPSIIKVLGKESWFQSIMKSVLDKKVTKLNSIGFENTPYSDAE